MDSTRNEKNMWRKKKPRGLAERVVACVKSRFQFRRRRLPKPMSPARLSSASAPGAPLRLPKCEYRYTKSSAAILDEFGYTHAVYYRSAWTAIANRCRSMSRCCTLARLIR